MTRAALRHVVRHPAGKEAVIRGFDAVGWLRTRYYDAGNTVVVGGAPRSGTTWLKEVTARVTGYLPVEEPLKPGKIAHLQPRYPITIRPYRRPEVDDPELRRFLRELLTGRHMRPDRRDAGSLLRFAQGRGLVVKEIRLNLLLPFFHRWFPDVRKVWVVRDPRATISSQIADPDGAWRNVRELHPAYLPLIEDRPDLAPPFELCTREEVLAAQWCLEHRFLEEHLGTLGSVHVTRYEDLYHAPEVELRRLVRFLGERWHDGHLAAVRRPSRTVKEGSALLTGDDPTTGYHRHLDAEALTRIDRVLDAYGRPFSYA